MHNYTRYGLFILLASSMLLQACSSTPGQPYTSSGKDPFNIATQADTAYDRGDWLIAENYYKELTRVVPKDAYAWTRLGNIRLRRNNFNGAITAYQKSLERDSESPRTHYNLATAHLLLARESLHSAQRLLPEQDQGAVLIEEKLSYFDLLIYEPVIDVTSPNTGLIKQN